jgi:glycosyltransferase involved in cell wall biosynthesis
MTEASLRVLITCRELQVRAGSELYTRDVAEALRDLGQTPVVFAPVLGEVASELRHRGVAVIDDLAQLGEAPDVIHGQHHLTAMAAMLRFPEVPALFVCHGWIPWQELPPKFPSLGRYVAVDALRRDLLVLEHGIPAERVTVIPNFVDLERFRRRPPLPAKPRRALLFSNQAAADGFVPPVARACAAAGLELDVVGIAAGRPAERPEELLPAYDLVFARGRAALEAMAVGAAVVLCDVEGCGPLVDEAGFAALRALNFGLAALRPPVEGERLRAEIARYDADDAARVCARVRAEADRFQAVGRLLAIYRELIASASGLGGEAGARAALADAARYVRWLAPYLDNAAELRAAQKEAETGRAQAQALEAALADAAVEAAQRNAELRAGEGERRRLADALARASVALAVLEGSPFSRLRARLLRVRPLVAAYRSIQGRRPRRGDEASGTAR